MLLGWQLRNFKTSASILPERAEFLLCLNGFVGMATGSATFGLRNECPRIEFEVLSGAVDSHLAIVRQP